MDRKHELEITRRSIAMLNTGQQALRWEEALDLIEELAEVSERLDRLRAGLAELVEADDAAKRHPAARRLGKVARPPEPSASSPEPQTPL